MSWLARSIANTLKLDDDGNEDDDVCHDPNHVETQTNNPNLSKQQNDDPSSPTSPSRGVKEDISELTKTLTRQFWGVASFLAPPPQSEPYKPIKDPDDPNKIDEKSKSGSDSDPDGSDQVKIAGIRSDFAEIGGKFRSGISKLSNNMAVSEFTKMATNLLQLGSDNEEEGEGSNLLRRAVGVTEEVVAFARDISMHPETWLDFPLPENDDDFNLSNAQQEHALAVEHLAPRLAALRIELCPGYMSEGSFWKIYFVLLHPRLDKQAAELLSTPQIVEARALLSHELQSRTKAKLQNSSVEATVESEDSPNSHQEEALSVPPKTSESVPITFVESAASSPAADSETEKHPVTSTEIQIVDKSVIEEKHVDYSEDRILHSHSSNLLVEKDEDDGDDWLKEETSEVGGASGAAITIENEEDVSFSDLEEDEEDAPASFKKISYGSDKDSREWVQLSKSSADTSKKVNSNHPETKESNDWLDVDDIDVA